MKTLSCAHRQRGVGMIEVLIAALILSFGITSIGMMMLASLQHSRGALLHARAMELAQDMAERIRNNSQARTSYLTAVANPSDQGCFQSGGTAPSGCSPEQLAQHDLWQWNRLLTTPVSGLPSATATIVASSDTPPLYEIRIEWLDGESPDGTAFTDSYVLEVAL